MFDQLDSSRLARNLRFLERYKIYLAVILIFLIGLGGLLVLYSAKNPKEEKSSFDIKVEVTGAVKKPGIYSLDSNSRIEDAIRLAGGITSQADLSKLKISLAAKLVDGQRIFVPSKSETSKAPEGQSQKGKININTASLEELDSLPGIGPTLGQRIIDWRKENGPFPSLEEIMEVSGIGEKKFEDIKDLITI